MAINDGERLMRLETKMEEHCQANSDAFARLELKIDEFIKGSDGKFASKLTEKIVYGLVGAVALSVLYFILKSVGIK